MNNNEVSLDEKQDLLDNLDDNNEGIELRHIFFAYAILFLCIIFFAS